MQIEQHEQGRLFNNMLYLGEGDYGDVMLRTTKGSRVRYGKNTLNEIDFPGEYDIAGTSVKCIEADDMLHFIITTEDERIVVLQKAAVLEVATFDAVDRWICLDKSIKIEIERLEMEGEIVVLGE